MKNNIILDKSFDFAVSIINRYKYLMAQHKEFVLSKQMKR